MKNLLSTVIFSLFFCSFYANDIDTSKIQQSCLEIHQSWLALNLELTKNTAGYSAPVAARSFLYISIAMAESSHWICNDFTGFSGRLNELQMPKQQIQGKVSYEHIANYVDYEIAKYFFSNTSPFDLNKIESKYQSEKNKYRKQYSRKSLNKSENYAHCIIDEIINWSKMDGGHNCWVKNFPEDYEIVYCDSCWVKTFPGYIGALQPYWGRNRLSLLENGSICNDIPYVPFSTDPKSTFYKEANAMNEVFEKFNSADIKTAKYWNDAPGVSGTPAGHIYAIALSLSKQYEKDLKSTLMLFATLGIALNDAVIECWRLKYEYNLIRPITYIHRYISKDFTTSIATPPFPEFPSGHSFQAGAGTEVLKYFFSDSIQFTDSTNQNRVDIDGSPRMYKSFSQMAEEMSLSRYFGGIHYMSTLDVSLLYGRKIGKKSIIFK